MEKSMKKSYLVFGAALSAALIVAGCGDSGHPGVVQIPVTGINNTNTYSFDLGTVDTSTGTYYVTDRTNKSIDVVDIASLKVTKQFKPGFYGCATAPANPAALTASCNAVGTAAVNNDASGPDGLDVVGANLFVGDVNKLWILDKVTGAKVATTAPVVNPIVIGGASGLRADEGCYDSVDGIYAISSPGENPPFMTIVDAVTLKVLATVYFQSAGLEACVYDATTAKFFVNNDGSTANGRGELSGYSAATFNALKAGATGLAPGTQYQFPGAALAGVNASPGIAFPGTTVAYALGACDPTGLALGPGTQIGSMCRQGNNGETLTFQILDKTNGTVLANLNAGGGDQITYDAGTNKWYLADSRWTVDGKSCGGGSATCVLTPMMATVDGTTRAVVMRPNGNNAHSIAVGSGYAITPFNKPSATAGGAGTQTLDSNGLAAGGINAFPL